MIKIFAVLGGMDLCEKVRQVFDELIREKRINTGAENQVEIEIINEVDVEKVKKMKLDADIIISRGAVAYILQQVNFGIPIVEIPVSGNDVISQLKEYRAKYKGKHLCAIGTSNMTLDIENYDAIWGGPIFVRNIMNHDDIKPAVDTAICDGMEIIYGGVKTCEYARQKGVPAILIASGKAAITYAILEAVRVAKLSLEEGKKNVRLNTILDSSDDGIIAVDNDLCITLFNERASAILDFPKHANLIGQSLNSLALPQQMKEIFHDITPRNDEVITIGSNTYTVKKVPLILKDMPVGSVLTFRNITEIQKLEGIIREKTHASGLVAKYNFCDILGTSPAISSAIKIAKIYSSVFSNVLIEGETGVGKELFAQSMHNASSRKNGPFVAINCGAIPENLLESELFGYVDGAFTGSRKGGKMGIFELAHGGTIFLDEISEIPYSLQGRLLRVLQEREVMRIGDNKVIPIDVKIISATNKKLEELTRVGKFREDLYYRLDILRLELPPLRERVDDIIPLVNSFLREHSQTHRDFKFSPEVVAELTAYPWRGNIRELRNICERLSIISKGDEVNLLALVEAMPQLKAKGVLPQKIGDFDSQIREIERSKILKAISDNMGNKSLAAKEMGMSRTTFWRKLKDLGIE